MAGYQDGFQPYRVMPKDGEKDVCNARPTVRESHTVGVCEECTFDKPAIESTAFGHRARHLGHMPPND